MISNGTFFKILNVCSCSKYVTYEGEATSWEKRTDCFLTTYKLHGAHVYHGLLLCCDKMILGEHFQKWVIDHNCLIMKLKMYVEWYEAHREVTDLKVCLTKSKCKDLMVSSWARLSVCIHFSHYIQDTSRREKAVSGFRSSAETLCGPELFRSLLVWHFR